MSDHYEVDLILHDETRNAFLVSETGHEGSAVWLPKSQVEVNYQRANLITLVMPEWLAEQKELV